MSDEQVAMTVEIGLYRYRLRSFMSEGKKRIGGLDGGGVF
jgi:hypothetical protein